MVWAYQRKEYVKTNACCLTWTLTIRVTPRVEKLRECEWRVCHYGCLDWKAWPSLHFCLMVSTYSVIMEKGSTLGFIILKTCRVELIVTQLLLGFLLFFCKSLFLCFGLMSASQITINVNSTLHFIKEGSVSFKIPKFEKKGLEAEFMNVQFRWGYWA